MTYDRVLLRLAFALVEDGWTMAQSAGLMGIPPAWFREQYRLGRGRCTRCFRVRVTRRYCAAHAIEERLRVRLRCGSRPWAEGHRGRPPLVTV